jgi:indolepyruvate ferredoxin oxidoreductase
MRLHQYAVKAAQAFARANKIDRSGIDWATESLGIISSG